MEWIWREYCVRKGRKRDDIWEKAKPAKTCGTRGLETPVPLLNYICLVARRITYSIYSCIVLSDFQLDPTISLSRFRLLIWVIGCISSLQRQTYKSGCLTTVDGATMIVFIAQISSTPASAMAETPDLPKQTPRNCPYHRHTQISRLPMVLHTRPAPCIRSILPSQRGKRSRQQCREVTLFGRSLERSQG